MRKKGTPPISRGCRVQASVTVHRWRTSPSQPSNLFGVVEEHRIGDFRHVTLLFHIDSAFGILSIFHSRHHCSSFHQANLSGACVLGDPSDNRSSLPHDVDDLHTRKTFNIGLITLKDAACNITHAMAGPGTKSGFTKRLHERCADDRIRRILGGYGLPYQCRTPYPLYSSSHGWLSASARTQVQETAGKV